jgi:uncharacterized protein
VECIYNLMVEITFDPPKDRINKKKHGISLARSWDFDWDSALYELDDSQDYGEARYVAIGFIDARLHVLTFTPAGENLRAISLRKATRDEESRYRQNQ